MSELIWVIPLSIAMLILMIILNKFWILYIWIFEIDFWFTFSKLIKLLYVSVHFTWKTQTRDLFYMKSKAWNYICMIKQNLCILPKRFYPIKITKTKVCQTNKMINICLLRAPDDWWYYVCLMIYLIKRIKV